MHLLKQLNGLEVTTAGLNGWHGNVWHALKEFGGMGFRNFKAFNLGMVAKQGWSFLSKPESLVARIFKLRYFPRSSFLGAKLGYNPSFAWLSIWKSRQLLLYGCRWIVGNGQQISVMNDPWVKGFQGSWTQSPQI